MAPATSGTNVYLELEERYSAHNYHPLGVVLERAEGVWVWDVEGKKYLDFLAAYGAVNQGHNHPRIVAALAEQAQRLALTSRAFRNDRFGPFCKKLAELTGYDKVLMMNAGAEAVETAIKAMRRWGYRRKGVAEGKAEILVFDGNFHGRTTTIVGFSSDAGARDGYGPFAPGFRSLPYGDADAVAKAIGPNTVGILVEPIQGEGGSSSRPRGSSAACAACATSTTCFSSATRSSRASVGRARSSRTPRPAFMPTASPSARRSPAVSIPSPPSSRTTT